MTLITRLADVQTLKALEAAGFGSDPELQSQLEKLTGHLREPNELGVGFRLAKLGIRASVKR